MPGKLQSTNLELLERAKHDGFVVSWLSTQPHVNHYWRYCVERNIPFLHVMQSKRYAQIRLDADPTGYPYSFQPPESFAAWIEELFYAHAKAPDAVGLRGTTHVVLWGIPNVQAVACARMIWDKCRLYITPPAERDRLNDLWRDWPSEEVEV